MSDLPDTPPTRIVASYTTIPNRYNILLQSIISMTNQTHKLDAIYLTIPKRASRLNQDYPPIPDSISTLCTVIYIDIDYGPITKMYGALISETDANTVIISCDDDVIFPTNYIESILKHHYNYPRSAICGTGALIGRGLPFISIVSTVKPFQPTNGFTGFTLDKNGKCVDLIFGVAGVLYVRNFFPHNDELHNEILQYSLLDQDIFLNDDVLISGYLSKRGIERRVLPNIPVIHHDNSDELIRKDALSSNAIKMIFRLNSSISKVKQYGFFPTMEPVPLDETPLGRVIIAIILIAIIIVLSICLYRLI